MFLVKYTPLILALCYVGGGQAQSILRKPIEKAGNALNDLANISIGAVKTAFDVVETGLDTAIEARDAIGDKIQQMIEEFRKKMGSAIEELGLPKLEPLEIPLLKFDIKHEIGLINGTANSITVRDLSLFKIDYLKANAPFMKVDLNLTFPTLRVKGKYDIVGLIGGMFNIYGKGPFEFTMYNLTAAIKTQLGYNKEHEFYMKKLDLYVKLGGMEAEFKNLMGGGENEKIFNKVIGELAPEAVDILWPELKPIVEERVMKIVQFSIIPKRIIRYTNKLTNLLSIRRFFNLFG